MLVHDLLADISLASGGLRHAILGRAILIVATRHLLHFHVGRYWLLAVNLADETLHALCNRLTDLGRHV